MAEKEDLAAQASSSADLRTAAKPEVPAKPPAAKLPPLEIDRVVDQWVVDYIYNSPIARNTACWNLLQKAKEILKQRLRGE